MSEIDPRVRALYYMYLLPDVYKRNFKDREVLKVLSDTVINILSCNKHELAQVIYKDLIHDRLQS
ncbi:hypothetical protein LCGC14_2583800 [marine sediment metagenome]|uniref:Uncharacterized protein n=1 Tax=marine sediment metagenome TaxID=412755 RepID=A0A0F9CPR3_9ZZZZ